MPRRKVRTGVTLAGIATEVPTSSKAMLPAPLRRKVPDLLKAIPPEDQDIGGLLGERMRINLERQLLTMDEGAYLKGHVERASKADSTTLAPGIPWQETDFPRSGEAVYRVEPSKPCTFALQLRVPEWANDFEAKIGDRTVKGRPGTILRLSRTWQRGDEVRIQVDLAVRTIPGAPTYPNEALIARGPQVLVLEKSLNPDVPWLHRTALTSLVPALRELDIPAGWRGTQVYAASGLVGTLGKEGEINPTAGPFVFVPFADAIEYRAWVALPGRLRRHVPAITAYGLASAQPHKLRPGVVVLEAISDEDPHTYCTCDPAATYTFDAMVHGRHGARGDPVSFTCRCRCSISSKPDRLSSRTLHRCRRLVRHVGGEATVSSGAKRAATTKR